jgi:toxin CptA
LLKAKITDLTHYLTINMPAKKYQPPLQLELNDSKRLIMLMVLIHALALLASVMNSLPSILKCVLLISLVSHCYFQLKKLKTTHQRIEHNETGWRLAMANSFEEIQILPSTVISVFAIFLHFKVDNKPKQTLVIVSDALADEDYRCLIVRLKTTLSNEV